MEVDVIFGLARLIDPEAWRDVDKHPHFRALWQARAPLATA